MVNTECWGMTKTFDFNEKHNGYALACGSGMMACGLSVQPPASSLKIYKLYIYHINKIKYNLNLSNR